MARHVCGRVEHARQLVTQTLSKLLYVGGGRRAPTDRGLVGGGIGAGQPPRLRLGCEGVVDLAGCDGCDGAVVDQRKTAGSTSG